MKKRAKITEEERNFISDDESNIAKENVLVEYNHSVSRKFESFFRKKLDDGADIELFLNFLLGFFD